MSINRLVAAKTFSKSSLFVAGGSLEYDIDAENYLVAVESADGQKLETSVRQAITKFVLGCKSDNIWTAIKASCILCGARTLSGALVPLVGTAPTNTNFVSGDYSRINGLTGNASNKWLNSNRNNNADPQNDQHVCCYVTTVGSGTTVYMGAGPATNETGATNFGYTGGNMFLRSRNNSNQNASSGTLLNGVSRNSSTSYVFRSGGANTSSTVTSQTPHNNNIFVFAATNGAFPTSARFSFYSIGTSLTLATLDSRLQILMAAITAALS